MFQSPNSFKIEFVNQNQKEEEEDKDT